MPQMTKFSFSRSATCLLAACCAIVATPAVSAASSSRVLTLRETRGASRPALDPSQSALIIIDAQREYLDGKLVLTNFPAAVAEISAARRWAHAHGVPVIIVQQISPATSTVFAAGSAGAEIAPELAPASDEIVVTKTYPNAFNKTELLRTLRGLGRKQVILTGFMAHMCLDSTARAAFDLDLDVFVIGSATAERSIPDAAGRLISADELRRATLAALNDRFAWIIPTAADLPDAPHF